MLKQPLQQKQIQKRDTEQHKAKIVEIYKSKSIIKTSPKA